MKHMPDPCAVKAGDNAGRGVPARCDLIFEGPIRRWDEGVPLGNGHTGALIWNTASGVRISVDKGGLWDRRPNPETLAETYTYARLIELVRNRDAEAVRREFEDFYCSPTPTKIPAGALELEPEGAAGTFRARLFLQEAVCALSAETEQGNARLESFVSAVEDVGHLLLSGPWKSWRLSAPQFQGTFDYSSWTEGAAFDVPGSLPLLGYPPARTFREAEAEWFVQEIPGQKGYALLLAWKKREDGKVHAVCAAALEEDAEDWLDRARERLSRALREGYEAARERHAAWWAEFWSKSALRLSDTRCERLWYVMNYLLASCSRKGGFPMPLQGLWTADDNALPPWKGDYHNDLNTQMSYWHYLKANHLPEGECFLDFLWKLVPQARTFARTFFDAPGLCLPSQMTIDGWPMGGWAMYSANLVNQIWLCQAFDQYWLYTADRDFLTEKAYPYFLETAQCVSRWLTLNADGEYELPLSSSPEIHDNSLDAWLTPNSNNDLALLIYLFDTLTQYCETLGKDGEQWREIRARLPAMQVTEEGVLKLSKDETLTESHRHHAHTMAIYPLLQYQYRREEDRRIIDATVSDLERLGSGKWIGFSFPWMAILYALQGNGEAAAYQLKLFEECFCSPNLFHLNGDYAKKGVSWWHSRQFTLEANMCAANAVQEMLLQDVSGIITVFPAVPKAWEPFAEFCDFRVTGGVLVSAKMENGRLRCASFTAEHARRIVLGNRFSFPIRLKTEAGEREFPPESEIAFELSGGASAELLSVF